MYNMKLAGGLQAGKFTDIGRVKSIKTCIRYCCDDKADCDLAFMLGKRYKKYYNFKNTYDVSFIRRYFD